MSKHTPGPWRANDANVFQDNPLDSVVLVASCSVIAVEYEERQANARLIADAPETAVERDKLKALCGEMLDALRKSNWALSTLADCTDDTYMSQRTFESLLGKNNDAIAKAEGEPE